MYRAKPYLRETLAPNRCLLREKSASKGGGEGLEKSQQKTDFFHLMASLKDKRHKSKLCEAQPRERGA